MKVSSTTRVTLARSLSKFVSKFVWPSVRLTRIFSPFTQIIANFCSLSHIEYTFVRKDTFRCGGRGDR